MKFSEFQSIFSTIRLNRYFLAMVGNTRKAMTLYRLNLRLSQELFTVISCFEVIFRNKINNHYIGLFGPDWLRDSASPGGMFDNPVLGKTPRIIRQATRNIGAYSHDKLISNMDFGFWRYMFASHQYQAAGSSLLSIFPNRLASTVLIHYNNNFIFGILEKINDLRNRIAHHEPICFLPYRPIKDTTYARERYYLMIQLFQWMGVDEVSLLYGLDHVDNIFNKIDTL